MSSRRCSGENGIVALQMTMEGHLNSSGNEFILTKPDVLNVVNLAIWVTSVRKTLLETGNLRQRRKEKRRPHQDLTPRNLATTAVEVNHLVRRNRYRKVTKVLTRTPLVPPLVTRYCYKLTGINIHLIHSNLNLSKMLIDFILCREKSPRKKIIEKLLPRETTQVLFPALNIIERNENSFAMNISATKKTLLTEMRISFKLLCDSIR